MKTLTKNLAIIAALFITLISFSASAQTNQPPDSPTRPAKIQNSDTIQNQDALQNNPNNSENPNTETGFEKSEEKKEEERNSYDLYEKQYNKKKQFEEFLKDRNSKKIV